MPISKCLRWGDEVADVGEELLVGVEVDLAVGRGLSWCHWSTWLQVVADRQQLAIAGAYSPDHGCCNRPERVLVHAGAGQRLSVDEVSRDRGDLESVDGDAVGTCQPSYGCYEHRIMQVASATRR